MVTPALWSVAFLDSSVLMKAPAAGLRRLYVTTAEAYMQNMQEEPGDGLSWSDLKHMPMHFNSSGDHGEEEEEEEEEDIHCWTLNPRLDRQQDAPNPGRYISDDAVRSSSPFEPESSNTDFIPPGQDLATLTPQIKHEYSDIEHFTQIPITPSSMYPSLQPRRRYNSLQSLKKTHLDAQDRASSSSPTVSAPSSQKRRVNSSFESRGSVESGARDEPSEIKLHAERPISSRKKGRYDALSTNNKAYDEHNSDDAERAYATPHSMFPGTVTATLGNKTSSGVEDACGDTDAVVSDEEELDAGSSMIMYERRVRAPARLITSMGDLTMRDRDDAREEELEGNSQSESGIDIDEFTDNGEHDDEGEYDVDAWP